MGLEDSYLGRGNGKGWEWKDVVKDVEKNDENKEEGVMKKRGKKGENQRERKKNGKEGCEGK